MGYMRHHTIVVTGFDIDHIKPIHDKSKSMFGQVSDIVKSPINGFFSFFVAPDGSKESWIDSEFGDYKRFQLKEYMRESCPMVDWFEVSYGGDGNEPIILEHSDS